MTSDSGIEDVSKTNLDSTEQSNIPATENPDMIEKEENAIDLDVENDITDLTDEASALKNLTADVRDQDDLERDITHQANLAFIDAEDKKDEKRIEKVQAGIQKLKAQKKTQEEQFRKAIGRPQLKQTIREKIARIEADIEYAHKDMVDLRARIEKRHQDGELAEQVQSGNHKLPNETHREFLLRTGKITPFANIGGPRPQGVEGGLADALVDAEDEAAAVMLDEEANYEPQSHQNLRAPGFDEEPNLAAVAVESEFGLRSRKKRKVQHDVASSDEFTPQASSPDANSIIDLKSEEDDARRPRKKPKKTTTDDDKVDLSKIDDGNEAGYQKRLADWVVRRSRARRRRRQEKREEGLEEADSDSEEEEWLKPSPDHDSHHFDNGLRVPGDIYPALFDYQKTGVQWLAELYHQKAGGIVGDEMGLGKTIQLISFIATLHHSNQLKKPVIVVAPATVLRQWVNEFHRWWPPLRVSILHSSGSGMLNVRAEGRIEDDERKWDETGSQKNVSKAAKKIVSRVVKHGHVLVTTYAGLQTYGEILTPVEWGYAVLDEGHKIRNPNSAVTIYCKELLTPHRVILSGTPMQNNLTELWSLFDFIFPMRLGTLVDFRNQFEIPIKQGGYANASNLQIMTAQKCAEVLKDTISPFLIQRLKVDVAADLPEKKEQVLFCKLTPTQRQEYQRFLDSKEMGAILKGSRNSLYGIDYLRKVCNHPDLTNASLKTQKGYNWGMSAGSGKMQIVKALLQMWKRFGHKTLLFSQGTQMLDILEVFVKRLGYIKYLRMDGGTAIKDRQNLVDQFNKNPEIDLFLLTTRVGGLGVNLTGANRVIIFDPDWNPSNDIQARERAWRLGQKKEVTIYRLMTAGTIEEKMYHRQIFKQFLSNKVLRDPKQVTTFQLKDLHDLFTLGSSGDEATETEKLFEGSEVKFSDAATRDGSPVSKQRAAEPTEATGIRNQQAKDDGDRDIRAIEGVAGVEDFEPDPDTKPAPTEEDRIMEGLFARSGLHSALEHDKIVNGKKQLRADPRMLQQEANRVAAEAAASLRRASEQTRSVPIGTVTWTGEVGEAGGPSNIRRGRGGPGSASVLAGLADRQGLNATAESSRSASSRGTKLGMKDFMKLIPEFIKTHGGQVPTASLVTHFNPLCVTSKQSDEFKTALERVAVMEKRGSRMRAIWALKPGY
ncbi:SNF2 family N-terminal domain-containing protein [Hypomontagnella submonticulosa]|nr:SNF2 family N-terminal domain-containing protein [Hypomontagnella submonticulosa]